MYRTLEVTTGDHYLAFVLNTHLKRDLNFYIYNTRFPVLKGDHITIAYNFGEKDVSVLQEFIDKTPSFFITEHLVADGIELLKITTSLGDTRPLGGTFHLTLSHREDRNPSDSNKVLNGEIEVLESFPSKFSSPLNLIGEFKLVPKKKLS